jgi:hypothetical protein
MNMSSHTQAARHSQQHGAAPRYSTMLDSGDSAWVEVNPTATDLQHRIEALGKRREAGDELDRLEVLQMFKAELTC